MPPQPEAFFYSDRTSLNGSMNIAPINLKTSSIDSPTSLKGRRMSHSNGRRKINARASGQQATSRRHQRMRAINVLISF
jgi:hypothetical protein